MWTDCRERIPIQTEWRRQGGGNSLSHPHLKNNALEACGKVPRVCVGGCSRSSTRVRPGGGYGERYGARYRLRYREGIPGDTGPDTGGTRGRMPGADTRGGGYQGGRIPGGGHGADIRDGRYGERSPGAERSGGRLRSRGAVTGCGCALRGCGCGHQRRVRAAGRVEAADTGDERRSGTARPGCLGASAAPTGGRGAGGGAHSCEAVFGRHRRPARGGRGRRGAGARGGGAREARGGAARPVRPATSGTAGGRCGQGRVYDRGRARTSTDSGAGTPYG